MRWQISIRSTLIRPISLSYQMEASLAVRLRVKSDTSFSQSSPHGRGSDLLYSPRHEVHNHGKKSNLPRNSSFMKSIRKKKLFTKSTDYQPPVAVSRKKKTKSVNLPRTCFDLRSALANIIFDDKTTCVATHLLQNTYGNPCKQIIRSMLEVSAIENCSSLFIMNLVRSEIEKEGVFRLPYQPVINIKHAGEEKLVLFSLPIKEYHVSLVTQGFVSMKCSSLIKRIDIFMKSRLSQPESLGDIGAGINLDRDVISTSILNKNHQFYDLLCIAFKTESPEKKLDLVFQCAEDILFKIDDVTRDDVPFDVAELLNLLHQNITDIISKENKEEIIFWSFLYPLINLTPVTCRRKTRIPTKHHALLLLVFFLIKRVCINPKGNDDDIFVSLCQLHEESIVTLHSMYQNIIKNIAVQDKNLGDTVLHFCSVPDDEKPFLALCEHFITNLDSIWEVLLQNPSQYESSLMNFIPFIRGGIHEESRG